uniref:Uncharacterized protein n=1 Tax=Candidatus Kentrum sp. SD TaxID=2126332 RepID=A0A450Z1A3_9GAMM|nr:MAG: hypothetical protein BECKSD772F_GA0070984_10938 [Candidatus Kentron sp. SD]VFK47576.1 MAG: hypothetical protein BECKSD772E_GA0070983_10988 [Candidatus Kentron sp. SD]VFK80285.1 MAG: hypothetical protein BECKSD772D_GA0070982_10997 [Candidatus Kentron sp. SD]
MRIVVGFCFLSITGAVMGFDGGAGDVLCKKALNEITNPGEMAEYQKHCSDHHHSEDAEKERDATEDEEGRGPEPERESENWSSWLNRGWNGVVSGAGSAADTVGSAIGDIKEFFDENTHSEDSGSGENNKGWYWPWEPEEEEKSLEGETIGI